MSGYDHKIETSLEGIENLSKEKNEEIERKVKEKSHYYKISIQNNRQKIWEMFNLRELCDVLH